MSKELNGKFLSACISNQKSRESLLGHDIDPLVRKAKQYHNIASKNFNRGLTERISLDFFHPQKSHFSEPDNGLVDPHKSDFELLDAENTFLSFLTQDKKQKKKDKKRKKKSKKLHSALNTSLEEMDPKNANIMAEWMKNSYNLVRHNGTIWIYNEEKGCYHPSSQKDIAAHLRSQLDEDEQLKISSRDFKEAYEQLTISEEINLEEKEFFENQIYVNCLNGVVDVKSSKLLEHSPEYLFKHCINARYIPGSRCGKFLEYVEKITAGDKELKLLLRVMLGYICSHYNNAKVAFLIYGIPHTGKSVLCNVISRIIGEEHIANIDLGMLHKQEYAASLSGKLLNVAPDLRNEPIKEVGFFKSLVSHDDMITARTLYENPRKIKCETKMLFSTNHLLSFHADIGIYDVEAVFNRLIYFPFQNAPITAQEDNKHLSDEIYAERDAIFTWSMEGLKYYVENNETFPACKLSDETKSRNIAQYCPEKIFVNQCLKKAEGRYESSSEIKKTFDQFCLEIGSKAKANISDYLEEHEYLKKTKKRIDADGFTTSEGNPIYVYEGIRLKKKYRSQKSEE